MSSPTQSELEENINQSDINEMHMDHEEYENYLEQYDRENHQEDNNYKRIFDGYHEIIDMTTFMIWDMQFVIDRKDDVMQAIDNLIVKKNEILENRSRECLDLCYCSDHGGLISRCKCICKCTYNLVSEQGKINRSIKGKEATSSRTNLCDKLHGINLPQINGNDIYDFATIGIIELEICLLHYKGQIEISIMKELEKEIQETDREILEQIYTMLQKI